MLSVANEPGSAECVSIQSICWPFANDFRSQKEGLCLNVYDVRLKDVIPACGLNWPLELIDVTSYLRVCSLSQRHALHYSLTQTATRC